MNLARLFPVSRCKPLLAAACLTAVFNAYGGVANDIPSCYGSPKLSGFLQAPKTELFVLIDQTVVLDKKLQNDVFENVSRLVQPGTAFTVATFSAFNSGRYLSVQTSGYLEPQLSEKTRYDISVKILKDFDNCMNSQLGFARKKVFDSIQTGFAESNSTLGKSDVLASMKEISARVRESAASDKLVFLISDMMENSSITSFYAGNAVRAVNPADEMKKVSAAQLTGDFGKARVHVMGAGLIHVPAGASGDNATYRDPKTMTSIKAFWTQYFSASNAELSQFGMPALVGAVR